MKGKQKDSHNKSIEMIIKEVMDRYNKGLLTIDELDMYIGKVKRMRQ